MILSEAYARFGREFDPFSQRVVDCWKNDCLRTTHDARLTMRFARSRFRPRQMPRLSLLAAALVATCATVAAQDKLACGTVPDIQAQCLLDCPDTLVKSDCSSYGVDCFCKNDQGEIENTNIEAPVLCGTESLEEACGKECDGESFIESFSCKKSKPDCKCAKDDGIKGLGDDATDADSDYADKIDDIAAEVEAELVKNPNPAPPSLLPNGTIIPSVADAAASAPTDGVAAAPSSAVAAFGGSVLAVAAGLALF